MDQTWITGAVETPVGAVPVISTSLDRADKLGAMRVRLGILRMNYAIPPALYAVGSPSPESPVFVSANYKLSFDALRRELHGMDAWVLVLDTHGINVWCAAGKGTFGTDEIVARINATRLAEVVSHRSVILPQLGGPGTAAHEVKKQTSFKVVFGPVRAADIPAFMEAGKKATPEMRRARFPFRDRIVLVPVELVEYGKHVIPIGALLFLLSGLGRDGYSSARAVMHGSRAVTMLVIAWIGGCVLPPALLPWLPGRAFAAKGAVVGFVLAGATLFLGLAPHSATLTGVELAAWMLLVPATTAFIAMNFTGASTYTSLSGVRREMRFAVPAQVAATVIGLILWVAARFV